MFVESEFSWTIIVQPHEFKGARQVQKALIRNVLTDFDSKKCTEEHGYFVAVTWIESVGEGTIKEGKGYITYPVSFRGLTFKPLQGEIVYGTVLKVVERGVKAECGPGDFGVDTLDDAGEGLMGKYKYHKEDGVWKHTDDGTQIELGTPIRAEIIKIEWLQQLNTFKIHGSLKGDFLGVVQLPSKRKSEESTGHDEE